MERNDIRMADFVQLLNNGMLNANNMKAGLGSKRFNYCSLHPVYSIIFSRKFLEKNMICIFRESLPGSSSRKIPSSDSLLEWFRSISLNICIRFALGQSTVSGFYMFLQFYT